MALKGYESVIGTASGIFSFVYYLFVSFFTYLISYFHNGTIWVLPLYFLSFACLLAFSYYVIVYRKTFKIKTHEYFVCFLAKIDFLNYIASLKQCHIESVGIPHIVVLAFYSFLLFFHSPPR